MNRNVLLALGAALVAIVAGIALLHEREPDHAVQIYLLDARQDSSGPLSQALPVIQQLERTYGAKVIVRAAASLNQRRDYDAMFAEFDRTRDANEQLPMFFALVRPYPKTKKALRATVEANASLREEFRIQLLERLVVVRDTDRLDDHDECTQLDDDVNYAKWNFQGIGLVVRDATIQGLRTCIDVLAPAGDA